MRESQIKGTASRLARSWLKWGQPLEDPTLGCVAVFWRGTERGWMGHVGLYVIEDSQHIFIIGGNQKDRVSIQAYPKSKLLGYRWPGLFIGPPAP